MKPLKWFWLDDKQSFNEWGKFGKDQLPSDKNFSHKESKLYFALFQIPSDGNW